MSVYGFTGSTVGRIVMKKLMSGMVVQSVLTPKSWGEDKARMWLTDNGFSAVDRPDESKNYLRWVQRNPSEFDRETIVSKFLDNGATLILGMLTGQAKDSLGLPVLSSWISDQQTVIDRTTISEIDGALVARIRLCRDGVLRYYVGDGFYAVADRPTEDLQRIADSVVGLTVTAGHPPGEVMVTPETYRDYAVGVLVPPIGVESFDGYSWVTSGIRVQDRDAIDRVNSGELGEVSLGAFVNWKPVVLDYNEQGESYNYRHENLRPNHAALVGTARAGHGARVIFDGADRSVLTSRGDQGMRKITFKIGAQTFVVDADDAVAEQISVAVQSVQDRADRSEAQVASLTKQVADLTKDNGDLRGKLALVVSPETAEMARSFDASIPLTGGDMAVKLAVLGKAGVDLKACDGKSDSYRDAFVDLEFSRVTTAAKDRSGDLVLDALFSQIPRGSGMQPCPGEGDLHRVIDNLFAGKEV